MLSSRNLTTVLKRLTQLAVRNGTFTALLVMWIVLAFATPYFLTPYNIFAILNAVAVIGIMAAAQTLCLLTGGIDLSVGSILGLSGVVAGYVMGRTMSLPLGILTGISVGAICGMTNGVLIVKGNLPPFIVTFGMM